MSTRRRGARKPLAGLLVACVALALAAAPAAAAGWGKPFQFQKPGTLDAIAPQLAFASGGASTAAFGTLQVDIPGTAQAQYSQRSADGHVAAVRNVPGARRILAMSYDGPRLELLAGTSGRLQDCCSAVEAVRVGSGGRPQRPRKLVPNLAGFTQGALETLAGGRMMAAVATERGVWVSQSARADRFAKDRRISPNRQVPVSMDAAWLGASNSIVAWTAGSGNVTGATVPNRIWVATGSAKHAPAHAKVAIAVPSGHRIDQVALARAHAGATLAWIESWYDKHGAYHSRVMVSDIVKHPSPRPLSPSGRIASGLSLGGDASGDQGAVWESCTAAGSCTVQGAGRPGGGRFSGVKTLGAIDPTQQPSLAIAPSGQLVAGWARGGHPVASVGFGKPKVLSRTIYAYAVTVAYGPKHVALAAWDQGTLHPSVVASAYRAR
ncbi:MAG TPA: hypothetical protein VFW09_08930 [Solirubrobacteraceae bacterium]|nr:hypothetical protein [Solirubrobacteraceae bacterium]